MSGLAAVTVGVSPPFLAGAEGPEEFSPASLLAFLCPLIVAASKVCAVLRRPLPNRFFKRWHCGAPEELWLIAVGAAIVACVSALAVKGARVVADRSG